MPGDDRRQHDVQRVQTHAERMAGRNGYFAPESVIRRVGSSPLIPLLGAGPAVLLQVAHPLVAASVVAHSDYRNDLWRRWLRTLRVLYLIVYGSRKEAERVGEAVHAAHARMRGATTTRLGPFPAGTPYGATDPALMLWVHATLTEVALTIFGRFVHRLAPEDERRFHRDMNTVARLVGVPPSIIPKTIAEFREFMRAQLAGPEITVTRPAQEIAAVVLEAPLPLALRGLVPAHRLASAGLLPARLRAEYGLAWGPGRAAALALAAASIRVASAPALLVAQRIPPSLFASVAAPLSGDG